LKNAVKGRICVGVVGVTAPPPEVVVVTFEMLLVTPPPAPCCAGRGMTRITGFLPVMFHWRIVSTVVENGGSGQRRYGFNPIPRPSCAGVIAGGVLGEFSTPSKPGRLCVFNNVLRDGILHLPFSEIRDKSPRRLDVLFNIPDRCVAVVAQRIA
jgi:hypothetical protein